MNAKSRSNSIITHEIDTSGLRPTITFHVRGVPEPLVLDTVNLSHAIRERALLHGLVQRISDAAAIPRDTATGLSATPEEKHEAMSALVGHYMSGTPDWTLNRASGDGPIGGLTIRAVAAVQGLSVTEMRTRIEELAEKRGVTTRAILAKLAKSQAVASKMEELRGEHGGSGLDGDELLAELG